MEINVAVPDGAVRPKNWQPFERELAKLLERYNYKDVIIEFVPGY